MWYIESILVYIHSSFEKQIIELSRSKEYMHLIKCYLNWLIKAEMVCVQVIFMIQEVLNI